MKKISYLRDMYDVNESEYRDGLSEFEYVTGLRPNKERIMINDDTIYGLAIYLNSTWVYDYGRFDTLYRMVNESFTEEIENHVFLTLQNQCACGNSECVNNIWTIGNIIDSVEISKRMATLCHIDRIIIKNLLKYSNKTCPKMNYRIPKSFTAPVRDKV